MSKITQIYPQIVASQNTTGALSLKIAAFDDGRTVVVWDHENSIYARLFGADGVALGDVFEVSDGESDWPDVIVLEDGSFVVAYTSEAEPNEIIVARRYDGDGQALGGEVTLYSSATHDGFAPHLTALEGGSYVAFYSLPRDGSFYGLYAQRYWPNGTSRGPDFQVNTSTEGYQALGDALGLPGGGFAVAWPSDEWGSFGSDAMLRLFDESGTPMTGEIRMNQYSLENQRHPELALLSDGRIVAAWDSYEQDGSGYGIFARIFHSNGYRDGAEFQINLETSGRQANPDVIAHDNGGFTVSWTDTSSGEVWARSFDASGTGSTKEFQLSDGKGEDVSELLVLDELLAMARTGDTSFAAIWLHQNEFFDGQLEIAWFDTDAQERLLRSDFDGDGHEDILFFNSVSGAVGQIEMANGGWSVMASASVGWAAVGTGDFDGDGFGDLLWYNAGTGRVGRYDVDLDTVSWRGVGRAGGDWEFAGTGDFNGDGIHDILWNNGATGAVGQYSMNSQGNASWQSLGSAGAGWAVAGIGDFNGDGLDDILWQNATSGALGQFRMEDTGRSWSKLPTLGDAWGVAGVGDFNGDGVDEILVFNEDSRAWGQFDLSDGSATWIGMGVGSSNWDIAGIGDFNADTRDDILWRNEMTGALGQYQMDGAAYVWEFVANTSNAWDLVI